MEIDFCRLTVKPVARQLIPLTIAQIGCRSSETGFKLFFDFFDFTGVTFFSEIFLTVALFFIIVPFYFYLLWFIFNSWTSTKASDKLLMFVFFLAISIGLFIFIIILFLAKSILQDKWIIKTNPFLKKELIMYEENKDVTITSNNMAVRLNLLNRDSVIIYCGDIVEAVKVMSLISSKIKSVKNTNNGK